MHLTLDALLLGSADKKQGEGVGMEGQGDNYKHTHPPSSFRMKDVCF